MGQGALLFPFRIEVRVEFFLGDRGIDAVFRHVDFGQPAQRVKDQFSEIVIAPVVVEMSAGETESATGVRPFNGPHHGFGASLGRLDVRVRAFWKYVGAIPRGVTWLCDKDWRERCSILFGNSIRAEAIGETDIEIPFVLRLERLYA